MNLSIFPKYIKKPFKLQTFSYSDLTQPNRVVNKYILKLIADLSLDFYELFI